MPARPAHRLSLAACAVALLATPAAAHALPVLSGSCGGTSFAVCLSLTDWMVGTGANGLTERQLRFTLANQTAADYAPATFTTFLIGGVGSAYDVTALTASSGSYTGTSSVDTPNDDNGFAGAGWTGSPQPHFIGWDNAGNVGLTAGNAVTLTFSFHKPVVASDFVSGDVFRSSLQFAVHAQGAAERVGTLCGSTSTKAVFEAGGSANAASTGAGAPPGCTVGIQQGSPVGTAVVPEPGTLVLMATGILGVGAVVVRRRRDASDG